MKLKKAVESLLGKHKNVRINLERKNLISQCVLNREINVSENGALVSVTPPESTGRSPKDTYIVNHPEISANIDWDSPNNVPMDPDTFEMILEDAMACFESKEKIYVTNRVVGADSSYALPVKSISNKALSVLFTDNMFRPIPEDIDRSMFADKEFILLLLPYDKLNPEKYEGRLRKKPDGTTSDMAVALDVYKRIGIVYGSAYLGSSKKMIFTAMNYILPEVGILPLHCSANEGKDGDIAIFAGLSGTGKTTLSADPNRKLLGDDEHGWSDDGIANFENGCYAKLIDLNPVKEPEIHHAITHEAPVEKHGAIVENAMYYHSMGFDFSDTRLTENSRGSYPLTMVENIKPSSVGGHPRRIIFLTADANGVLPPVAKLDKNQAMFWFIMGYTSKLAGTETGITEPKATFSRFFGEPFMPRNPDVYASMLGEKMDQHDAQVFLVNTGWSGGPYRIGKRIDIMVTRAIITGVLDTELEGVEYEHDNRFHIWVPKTFPGVDANILQPKNTWEDKEAFEKRADDLAKKFYAHFEKAYGNKNIAPEVVACCPGR